MNHEWFVLKSARITNELDFNDGRNDDVKAVITLYVKGKKQVVAHDGLGPGDAAFHALKKALAEHYPLAEKIALAAFDISFPEIREKGTKSTVICNISLQYNGSRNAFTGQDVNWEKSLVLALAKGFNFCLDQIHQTAGYARLGSRSIEIY